MSKRIKRLSIIILTAIMILSAGLMLFATNARATYADGEEDFTFTPGAYTSYTLLEDNAGNFNGWAMAFELKKLTPKFESLTTAPGGWWWWDKTPYLSYTFSFYRKDGEENVKLYTYSVFLSGDKKSNEYSLKIEETKHVYYAEKIFFADSRLEHLNNSMFSSKKMPDGTTKYSTEVKAKASAFNGKVNLPFSDNNVLKLVIVPGSAYSDYFVTLDYDLFMWSSDSINRSEIKLSGTCQSSVRSLYTVFKNMEDAGALRDNIESDAAYNNAYDTIHKKVEKTVVISYLMQIPGTPFATTKTQSATVTVREDDPALPADEAARVLSVKTFDCLGSYCNGFKTGDSVNSYVADYYNNVWLKARTVDGNDYNYFLNINESYASFYNHFVDAGIFERGAYETVFSSQIYAKYSEQLAGYSPETVHGYFGFAMIPKTYGINTLWKEFFDTKTSKSGIISTFEYGVDLSLASYNKLLEDYNYAFLSRIWNDTANLFTSGSEDTTCYILYAEPGTKTSFIAENGAEDITDDSGAAVKPLKNVGAFIGGVFDSVTNGLAGIGSWLKGLDSRAKSLLIVVVAVLSIATFIILSRNFGSKKRR